MPTKIPQNQLADINVVAIDPTVNDDASLRYGVGSKWFNTVSQAFFICEDATVGAAVWTQTAGGSGGGFTYSSGVFQQAGNDATQTVIPHGLGVIPKFIKITAMGGVGAGANSSFESIGTYDGINTNTDYYYNAAGTGFPTSNNDTTNIIYLVWADPSHIVAVATIDATNITLTWTITGGGTGVNQSYLWEAFASAVGGAEKKVGVGDTSDISWFNIQYPFAQNSTIGGPDPDSMWISSANVTNPSFYTPGSQQFFRANNTGNNGMLPDFDLLQDLTFDGGKQVIFQCAVSTYVAPAVNEALGGIGFNPFTQSSICNAQGLNIGDSEIGFVRKESDGTWYARTSKSSGGAGFTETLITISDGKHVFRCEYDPGNATPQARYYVDGVLLATITTNLPTADAGIIGFAGGNGTTVNSHAFTMLGTPSFAVEI